MGTPTTWTCTTTSTATLMRFTTLRYTPESLYARACVFNIRPRPLLYFVCSLVRRRRSVVGNHPFFLVSTTIPAYITHHTHTIIRYLLAGSFNCPLRLLYSLPITVHCAALHFVDPTPYHTL